MLRLKPNFFIFTGLSIGISLFLVLQKQKAISIASGIEDKNFFYQLVKKPLLLEDQLVMGIVPHHLLAKPWISEFWATVGKQKPERIILISPNHFDTNLNKITTSKQNSSQFSQVPFIQADDEIVAQDHGVTTHMPFIRYFSPKSELIPLVVNNTTTKEELQLLVENLKSNFNSKKDVIVASIDFSHYLNRTLADQKDQETLYLVTAQNTDAIFRLTNDHVDARAGLVLYLLLTKAFACQAQTIYHHGNSADFAPKTSTNSTSYFVAGITIDQCQGLTYP